MARPGTLAEDFSAASAASAESQWDVADGVPAQNGPERTLQDVRDEMRAAASDAEREELLASWRDRLESVARDGRPAQVAEAVKELIAVAVDPRSSPDFSRGTMRGILDLPVIGIPEDSRLRDIPLEVNRAVLEVLYKDVEAVNSVFWDKRDCTWDEPIILYIFDVCESLLELEVADTNLVSRCLDLVTRAILALNNEADYKLTQRPLLQLMLSSCTVTDVHIESARLQTRRVVVRALHQWASRCLEWRDRGLWIAESIMWAQKSDERLQVWLAALKNLHCEILRHETPAADRLLLEQICGLFGLFLPTYSSWRPESALINKGVRYLVRGFQHLLVDSDHPRSPQSLCFFIEGLCFAYTRLQSEPAYLLRLLHREELQKLLFGSPLRNARLQAWAYLLACLDSTHLDTKVLKNSKREVIGSGWGIVIQPALEGMLDEGLTREQDRQWILASVTELLSTPPANADVCLAARKRFLLDSGPSTWTRRGPSAVPVEALRARLPLCDVTKVAAFFQRTEFPLRAQGQDLLLKRTLSPLWAHAEAHPREDASSLAAVIELAGLANAAAFAASTPLSDRWSLDVICDPRLIQVLSAQLDAVLGVLDKHAGEPKIKDRVRGPFESIVQTALHNGTFADQALRRRQQNGPWRLLEERVCTWIGFSAFQHALTLAYPEIESNDDKDRDCIPADLAALLLPRSKPQASAWFRAQFVEHVVDSFGLYVLMRCAAQTKDSAESSILAEAAAVGAERALDADLAALWLTVRKRERAFVLSQLFVHLHASADVVVSRMLETLPRQDPSRARQLWVMLCALFTKLSANVESEGERNVNAIKSSMLFVEHLLRAYLAQRDALHGVAPRVSRLFAEAARVCQREPDLGCGLGYFVALAREMSGALADPGPDKDTAASIADAILAGLIDLGRASASTAVAAGSVFSESFARELRPLFRLATNPSLEATLWAGPFAQSGVRKPEPIRIEAARVDAEGFVMAPASVSKLKAQQQEPGDGPPLNKRRRRHEHLTEHQKEQRKQRVTVAGFNNLDASQMRIGTLETQSSEGEGSVDDHHADDAAVFDDGPQEDDDADFAHHQSDDAGTAGDQGGDVVHAARFASPASFVSPRGNLNPGPESPWRKRRDERSASSTLLSPLQTVVAQAASGGQGRSFRVGRTEALITEISEVLKQSASVNAKLARIKASLARTSGKLADPSKRKVTKYEGELESHFTELAETWIHAQRLARQFKTACAKLESQRSKARTHRQLDFSSLDS